MYMYIHLFMLIYFLNIIIPKEKDSKASYSRPVPDASRDAIRTRTGRVLGHLIKIKR